MTPGRCPQCDALLPIVKFGGGTAPIVWGTCKNCK